MEQSVRRFQSFPTQTSAVGKEWQMRIRQVEMSEFGLVLLCSTHLLAFISLFLDFAFFTRELDRAFLGREITP